MNEPTEPVSFTAIEKRQEALPAKQDLGSFLELLMGVLLIGATTLAAVLPLLAMTSHPIGVVLIVISMAAAALCGALARDFGDE